MKIKTRITVQCLINLQIITSKREENRLCVFGTKFPVKTSFILDTILYDIGKMVDHHQRTLDPRSRLRRIRFRSWNKLSWGWFVPGGTQHDQGACARLPSL